MNAKERYIRAVVYHEKTDMIASGVDNSVVYVGGQFETFENGPLGGGLDGFGVEWHCTESSGGQPVPAPGKVVLEDIENWESVVFPDLDKYDWKGQAEMQLAGVNRDEQAIEYSSWNAQFMRLTHLMGFMEGLCTLAEEPEMCMGLMDAISDYKIMIVERVAHYFKPDFFVSFDDVATQQGLFISPSLYRETIKPYHKKVNDAIKAYGMYPMIHTCGKCESLIEDFIDEGHVAWTSAQPMNDIPGILKKYGDRISVIGGFDSNGAPGRADCPDEITDAEVKRCMETYGPYPGYVFLGVKMLATSDMNEFMKSLQPIIEASEKYRVLY